MSFVNMCIKISKFTSIVFCMIAIATACSSSKKTDASVDPSLPSLAGEFDKWKVFTIEQDGKKVCYTTSTPIEEKGNHTGDRDAYVMVSFFGANKQEISVSSGYQYRGGSIVSVSIDGYQERFIAESDTIAWPEKVGSDKSVIDKLKSGFKLLTFSESSVGTYSVDTYSLSGFKKAYQKAKSLCEKE